MLTPSFSVEETPTHIVVKVRLASIHCRVSEAQFDICDERFTLFCKPYYLRLRFDQPLTEGKDERATYNVETNVLTVYAPKLRENETFTNLHDPAYLIATEKQRALMSRPPAKPLIQVLDSTPAVASGEGSDGDDDGDEDDETEYVQTLRNAALADDAIAASAEGASAHVITYGFNGDFSNVFGALDEATVYDAIELRQPDRVTREERRAMRVADELKSFHEDAMWYSLADEEGDVEMLLHGGFVPHYVRTFESVLARDGVQYIAPLRRVVTSRLSEDEVAAAAAATGELPRDAAEVDDGVMEGMDALQSSREVEVPVWNGNIASFDVMQAGSTTAAAAPEVAPLDEYSTYGAAESTDDSLQASSTFGSPLTPARRIAAPTHPIEATFDYEETDMLTRLLPPSTTFRGGATGSSSSQELLPPHEPHVLALTLDLLLAYSYDHLTSEGTSSSESVWTICKLSPSLSWLDTQDSLYEVCVVFARRVLTFPLHRHLNLIRRCFRDVGVIMLLGPSYVVKALLALKYILDRSEHKMVLSTIFLNPLLRYWQRKPRAAAVAQLHATALELHDIATRHAPVKPRSVKQSAALLNLSGMDDRMTAVQRMCAQGSSSSAPSMEYPITITTIGLPIQGI